MFERYNDYFHIYVVGPQRAGTRIAARMIAADLYGEYVDETSFYIDSVSHLWRMTRQLKPFSRLVIQGPGITNYATFLARKDPKDLVVFMKRPLPAIIASENRINWRYNQVECAKIGTSGSKPGDAARAKRRLWNAKWKPQLKRKGIAFIELNYGDLSRHPMWKPKAKREGFKWNQTK